MDTKVIGSVVRTVGATLSGVLIANGLPPEVVEPLVDPVASAVVGGVLALGLQIWSLLEKKARKLKF